MKKFITPERLQNELDDKRVVLQAKQAEVEQIEAWIEHKQSQIDKLESLLDENPDLVDGGDEEEFSDSEESAQGFENQPVNERPPVRHPEKVASNGNPKNFGSLKV